MLSIHKLYKEVQSYLMGLVALKIAKHFNPFLASVPILYLLKTQKILLFFWCFFRGYKLGTLATNLLKQVKLTENFQLIKPRDYLIISITRRNWYIKKVRGGEVLVEILEFSVFGGGRNILNFRGGCPMRGFIFLSGKSVHSPSIFPFWNGRFQKFRIFACGALIFNIHIFRFKMDWKL